MSTFWIFSELFPAINNGPIPSEIEIQGRNLERALERVIRVKRTERRNMRVGQICSRDLYRVGMNDPHIFMRKGQPMKADMAVFLLGDNSGSMSSQGAKIDLNGHAEYACKSNLARIASAIIERGLSKFAAIKVSLFDVSGGVIRHSTIKKFDERVTNNNKCYNSIKDVGIGGGNKDGYSIRVATKDLMARRESRKDPGRPLRRPALRLQRRRADWHERCQGGRQGGPPQGDHRHPHHVWPRLRPGAAEG